MPPTIHLKRVYDDPAAEDGRRVLIDGLWPRGVAKASAPFDRWTKDFAPSPELRKWFDHRPERFAEFTERYRAELADRTEAARALLAEAGDAPLTLLYAARDTEHNHAVVLRAFLSELA
ncbi:MAG: DUF488 family protein [Planctomycetota bacterium]